MRPRLSAAVMLLAASPAAAGEVVEGEHVFASDLPARGSGVDNAAFGLTTGRDLHLWFIPDSRERQLAELGGEAGPRPVPNIPVVFVLTQ